MLELIESAFNSLDGSVLNCFERSRLISDYLNTRGLDAHVVSGAFVFRDGSNVYANAHAWISVNGSWVEVSGSQFGLPDLCFISSEMRGFYLLI